MTNGSKIRVTKEMIAAGYKQITQYKDQVKRLEMIKEQSGIECIKMLVQSAKNAVEENRNDLERIASTPTTNEQDLKDLRIAGGKLSVNRKLLEEFGDPSKEIDKVKNRISHLENQLEATKEGQVINT